MSTGINHSAASTTATASGSPITANSEPMTLGNRLADYLELTKPRIVVLELIAVLIALHVASGYGAPGSPWSLALMLGVSIGTALVAGSANALNQWLEQERDILMTRTKSRPMPAGRLTSNEGLMFSVLTLAMGCSTLAMFAGPMPAFMAVATWVVYVGFYTPLKTRSWFNTTVGAVSGAMPLAIGWTAGGGTLSDGMIWHLMGVMFLWQFPHFIAIAWLCRDDYSKAGYQMSTTLDPTGWWAGMQSILGSLLLIPVSLLPIVLSDSISYVGYTVSLFLCGLVMLQASIKFHSEPNDKTARKLMRYSLLYVPIWLLSLWLSAA